MAKILIVEDDPSIAEGVSDRLAADGYEVVVVRDGKIALQQARAGGIDLIILDVMLPGALSGFGVCQILRDEGSRVPILILIARREEIDRVRGLDLGADDYMVKPFGVAELQARVRALLRRSGGDAKHVASVRFGRAEVDFERRVAWVKAKEVHLTPKAFGVLQALAGRQDRAVSRETLLNEVWGYDAEMPTTRAVDVVIAELRDKLESSAKSPRHIVTVFRVGYKFIGGRQV